MTEEKQKPKAKPIPATVINVRGESALVEFRKAGKLKRVIIPAAEASNQMDPDILEMGIPYGLPWESIVTLSVTSETLAERLREAGLWTVEDINANPRAVYGALQAAYGVDLAAILQAAANHKGVITHG